MNKRFVAVLIFAFVVASGASLMLYRLMSNRSARADTPHPTAKLALAARDLELGAVLREEDVALTDWAGPVPIGAMTRVQDAVGRGVTTKIIAKEPILESRLAPKGAGGGFAVIIPKGMRAVAVAVNEVVGVAGFVTPGVHVDVLISGAPPNGAANLGTLTKTMLQNIEVLSAGQDFKKDAEGKPVMVQVVNLLVTPEQAEQLSLASHQTTIQLILRNPLDHETTKTLGASTASIFGGKFKMPDNSNLGGDYDPKPARPTRPAAVVKPVAQVLPPPPPPKKETFVVEIITGTKKAETTFGGNGEGK